MRSLDFLFRRKLTTAIEERIKDQAIALENIWGDRQDHVALRYMDAAGRIRGFREVLTLCEEVARELVEKGE